MPPKVKEESFTDTLRELKKLASSMQKKLEATVDRIDNASGETREAQRKMEYEREKSNFKFSDKCKEELLDTLLDIDKLWIYEEPNSEIGIYTVADYLNENCEGFYEKILDIMLKARDEISDILPIPTASSRREKFSFNMFKNDRRKKEDQFEDEDEEEEEEEDQ